MPGTISGVSYHLHLLIFLMRWLTTIARAQRLTRRGHVQPVVTVVVPDTALRKQLQRQQVSTVVIRQLTSDANGVRRRVYHSLYIYIYILLMRGTILSGPNIVGKNSEMYRFLCVPWVLFHMPPRYIKGAFSSTFL